VVIPTEQERLMQNDQDLAEVTDAREVLAAWLAAHSAAPETWTPETLADWRTTRVDEWLHFLPPGNVNQAFLVAGSNVFSFALSQYTPADALAAARASRPEDAR
jgi:hypothetical protein